MHQNSSASGRLGQWGCRPVSSFRRMGRATRSAWNGRTGSYPAREMAAVLASRGDRTFLPGPDRAKHSPSGALCAAPLSCSTAGTGRTRRRRSVVVWCLAIGRSVGVWRPLSGLTSFLGPLMTPPISHEQEHTKWAWDEGLFQHLVLRQCS